MDYVVATPEVSTVIHALERVPLSNDTAGCAYVPIRFFPQEKLLAADKLLLGFDAIAMSHIFGTSPRVGKIFHGSRFAMVRVSLVGLLHKAQSVLSTIAAQQAKASSPPLVLNKHCPACEFQARCRELAA
jgi:hypothetical protein